MTFNFDTISDKSMDSWKDNNQEGQIYNLKSNRISNAKQQSQLQWKYFIFQSLLCFSNIICLICVSFLLFANYQSELIFDVCTLFSFLSSIFHIFKAVNQQKFHQDVYEDAYGFQIQRLVWNIILGVYYLIHPSFVTYNISVAINQLSFKLNSLLTMLVFLRLFNVIYFFIIASRFYGARVARVLNIYAVKSKLSLSYAIRCLFKVKGLKMPLFILLSFLILIPFLRIAFCDSLGINGNFLQELYDTVITMTTVGYGQISHSTNSIMRLGIVLIILAGSFTSSLLTLTIIKFFQLSNPEHKAFVTLNRLEIQQRIRQERTKNLETFIKNSNKLNAVTNPQIRKNKTLLKQYHFRQQFAQYYNSQFINLQRDIKKIVEKQQIIDNLMRFYFQRRNKSEQQSFKQKGIKRAKDTQQYSHLFDMILSISQ